MCQKKGKSLTLNSVFQRVCGSGGLKSRLAKVAGAELGRQMKDEELHAVVAQSKIWKQKASKTDRFGALLKIEMSKKCKPLWCEAYLQVKSVQNFGS